MNRLADRDDESASIQDADDAAPQAAGLPRGRLQVRACHLGGDPAARRVAQQEHVPAPVAHQRLEHGQHGLDVRLALRVAALLWGPPVEVRIVDRVVAGVELGEVRGWKLRAVPAGPISEVRREPARGRSRGR